MRLKYCQFQQIFLKMCFELCMSTALSTCCFRFSACYYVQLKNLKRNDMIIIFSLLIHKYVNYINIKIYKHSCMQSYKIQSIVYMDISAMSNAAFAQNTFNVNKHISNN